MWFSSNTLAGAAVGLLLAVPTLAVPNCGGSANCASPEVADIANGRGVGAAVAAAAAAAIFAPKPRHGKAATGEKHVSAAEKEPSAGIEKRGLAFNHILDDLKHLRNMADRIKPLVGRPFTEKNNQKLIFHLERIADNADSKIPKLRRTSPLSGFWSKFVSEEAGEMAWAFQRALRDLQKSYPGSIDQDSVSELVKALNRAQGSVQAFIVGVSAFNWEKGQYKNDFVKAINVLSGGFSGAIATWSGASGVCPMTGCIRAVGGGESYEDHRADCRKFLAITETVTPTGTVTVTRRQARPTPSTVTLTTTMRVRDGDQFRTITSTTTATMLLLPSGTSTQTETETDYETSTRLTTRFSTRTETATATATSTSTMTQTRTIRPVVRPLNIIAAAVTLAIPMTPERTVPAYAAGECSSAEDYIQACVCWGVAPALVTVTAAVPTETVVRMVGGGRVRGGVADGMVLS